VLGQGLLAAVELVLLRVELELDVRLTLGEHTLALLDLLLLPAHLVPPLGECLLLRCQPAAPVLDVGRVDLDGVRAPELGLSRGELDRCFRSAGARMTYDDFRRCIDDKSTGAVRVSLGLVSNFDDVEAFLDFARSFVDR